MTTHSSVLAWRIPGTGEPGGLPSMGSHRVRYDWSYLAAVAAARRFFFLCKKIFNSYSYGLDCTPCPNLHVEILPQASISERDLIWRGSLLRQSSLNKVIAVDPNLFWPVSYKKGKFDHRQSKCHVYVKIQFMSQGERPGIDPSFTALRRNQRCQHLNFWTYLFRK